METKTSGSVGSARSLSPHAQAALERIHARYPDADPVGLLPDVDPAKIPVHIAMIMDGNGRWAQERGLPRIKGHQKGVETVRSMLKACASVGVEYVTLYSFSTENWSRPQEEIQGLMEMCVAYCEYEQAALKENNVRVKVLGRREGMPQAALEALDSLVEATKDCTGITMCLAVNYGARDEIVDAARALVRKAKLGQLNEEDISHEVFSNELTTGGLPDPDLLIRTGGEFRLSNYLLWQLSYAEIMISETAWPDFDRDELFSMIKSFAARSRRFGKTDAQIDQG